MKNIYFLFILIALLSVEPVAAQKKSTTGKKPPATTKQKSNTGTKKKSTTANSHDQKVKAGKIPQGKVDSLKTQVAPMVKFYESTLNFLADRRNSVNEKQIIITQSYLKFTWDEEVQVEDDLDDNRLVPLYKDMPAYLSDVDFFFKGAKFKYTVQDVSLLANQEGLTYFKVIANRNLKAINLNGDSVNSNKVRYIELNYDSVKQQMKIVSVYTTKLNEKDDLRRWWNGLSQGWKDILAKEQTFDNGMRLANIGHYNDTVALVEGNEITIDKSQFYNLLAGITRSTSIDVSGNVLISDLEPLGKLTELVSVNVAGTPVSDLMPLRNLNKLESLDISNTSVTSLEPLRYCTNLRTLKLKGTSVEALDILPVFPALESIDISGTGAKTLEPLREMKSIRDLRLRHTAIADLSPISGLTNLEMLNISGTPVEDLGSLKNMAQLRILFCDSTKVSRLDQLNDLTGLQKVYCDQSKVTDAEVRNFLKRHPGTSLVYQSVALQQWWKALPAEWQKIFGFYVDISEPATTEQLHRLALTDSININGRVTISSLEPLKRLIMLRQLHCQSTAVTDLTPLSELSDLHLINASNTRISGIKPLSGLANLETLQIDNTSVGELMPLYNLQSLQLVLADNSQVNLMEANRFTDKNKGALLIFQTFDNTNWWKGLDQPWKDVMLLQLNLTGTPDKFQLQQLANLEKVAISEVYQITDLTPLLHLSRLRELQFSGTRVSKLDPVTSMPSLVALRCPNNPISDLTPLTGLPNLKELDFSNTQVEDLLALQNMIQLESLKFSGTPVKNLKYLQKLINLNTLEFYNTRVSNIDVLDKMPDLKSVKMFSTRVSAKKVDKLRAMRPGCEIVF